MRARHACAAVGLAGALPLGLGACGDEASTGCPTETEELSAVDVDLFRQLEVCASRVHGVTIRRPRPPRVEVDPELVECASSSTGTCVTTPAGQAVSGYYLRECDTITAVDPAVVYHEMIHPILCDVPDLECDPGHRSPVWIECTQIKACPEGRLILEERVCDGTSDCAGGEDEAGCG